MGPSRLLRHVTNAGQTIPPQPHIRSFDVSTFAGCGSVNGNANAREFNMASFIDTREIPQSHPETWFARTLATHNGVNLKFRVMRGTIADFHVHATSPECFFVVSGMVTIDRDSESITLGPGQFVEVPAGVRHRSRVEGEATVLVFDGLAP